MENNSLLDECEKYDIPIYKKDGNTYAPSTLKRKLEDAKKNYQGSKGSQRYERSGRSEGYEKSEESDRSHDQSEEVDPKDPSVLSERRVKRLSQEEVNDLPSLLKGLETSEGSEKEESLFPGEDYHVNYKKGRTGQAILEDPLIQAYFHSRNQNEIFDDSEIPVGLAMAVYGNHAQLGDSGLTRRLPDLLDNQELQDYWDARGIKKVNTQTMLPVRFLYLLDEF